MKDSVRNRLSIFGTLVAGCVLTGIVGSLIYYSEVRDLKSVFMDKAHNRIESIRDYTSKNLLQMDSLRSIFEMDWDVSRKEFRALARNYLSHELGLRTVKWIPRVTHQNRGDVEAQVKHYAPNFVFKKISGDGEVVVSPKQNHYLPVVYIEPFLTNSEAMGLDFTHRRRFKQSIDKAHTSDRVVTSSAFNVIDRDQTKDKGFFMVAPIFRENPTTGVRDYKDRFLKGFVVSKFYVQDFISAALKGLAPGHTDIYVYDVDDNYSLLHHHVSRSNSLYGKETATMPRDVLLKDDKIKQDTIKVGNRTWEVICRDVKRYRLLVHHRGTVAIVLGGLFFTLITTLYVAILIRRRQEMKMLALNDTLTELPNRPAFFSDLINLKGRYASGDGHYAIFFMDIDKFKAVNDTFGHDAGDELLKKVSEKLKSVVGDQGKVYRLGGDEFTVILFDIGTQDECRHIGQQLIESISTPIRLTRHTVNVGTSIGAALYPIDSDDPEVLVKLSDECMYVSKEAGGNTISFVNPDAPAAAPKKSTVRRGSRSRKKKDDLR